MSYYEPEEEFNWKWFFGWVATVLLIVLLLSSCGKHEKTRVELYRDRLPALTTVRSSLSMRGYKAGDMLIISAHDYKSLKPGDHVLVWYDNSDIPYFHLAKRQVFSEMPPHTRWLVQGDNNQYPDIELMSELTYV